MTKHEIKRLDRTDGKRYVSVMARGDGRYEYEEWDEDFEDLRDVGGLIERIWVPLEFSGIYGSADEAERDTRLTVPRLRENSN
jgi:hypothetical protein